jgi:hypothetical protein
MVALGMTPLASAPAANADFGLDDLLDVIDPNLVAGAVDPTAGLEWSAPSRRCRGLSRFWWARHY